MKDIKEFEKEIIGKLEEHYGSGNVTLKPVTKLNGVVFTSVRIDEMGDAKASPIFYVEQLFERYSRGFVTVDELVDEIIDTYENVDAGILEFAATLTDYESIKDSVFPILVSKTENIDLLDTYVSQEFLDLAVMYIVRTTGNDGGCVQVKITWDMLNVLGVTLEELHNQALANMEADGYTFTSIEETLKHMMKLKDCDEEVDEIFKEPEEGSFMYVITNHKSFGAAGILNADFMQKKLNGKDAFIIPSSVHEVLVVPNCDAVRVEELSTMIGEVNTSEVSPEDRLSYHPYYYSAATGSITIAA